MEDKIVRAMRAPEKQAGALKMRRAMTNAEDILWQRLRRNQLLGLHFRRQQVIDGFIVDFYCREARLVIECDGEVHEQQQDYDRERDRDRILATHALQVLRFANTQIETDTKTVLASAATATRAYLSQHYQP